MRSPPLMLDRNASMLPHGLPERRTDRLKTLLRRQIPGATEESVLRALSSHDAACRANDGTTGKCKRAISGARKDRRCGRDARPAMLLLRPAVRARRLSTRSSLSKSVPCNIIVIATGSCPVRNYLKPKVTPVAPSTRVTGLSEKNVVAYNFVSVRRFSATRQVENAVLALARTAPVAAAAARI